jgi:translation initiation factor IF-3
MPTKVFKSSVPAAPAVPINEQIKFSPVRVIVPGNLTEDGEPTDVMAGIFPIGEALKMAESYQLDLVLINEKGDPPVCKVIDFGKFKYGLEKRKKENNKKQLKVEVKEVKMSYKIDQHDFDVRLRAVQKFIGDVDKVFITLIFFLM